MAVKSKPLSAPLPCRHQSAYVYAAQIPGCSFFLWEHPENEAAILVRLKGRGDYGVFSWRKFEAIAHFPCVDEGAAHGHSSLSQQDVRTQVNIAAAFELRIYIRKWFYYCNVKQNYWPSSHGGPMHFYVMLRVETGWKGIIAKGG